MRGIDGRFNAASLCLLLAAILVVTFFYLRLAIRLRLAHPDHLQLQEAHSGLKMALILSVGWIGIILLSALSGSQPHAFTCQVQF
jgi:hypothetical protein